MMMRRETAIAAALLLLAATGCAGDAQAPGPARSASQASKAWEDLPDIRGFYPAKARDEGVGGEVELRCTLDSHFALKDCRVARESPEGYGFGAAALSMAALSQPNLAVDLEEKADVPRIVTFKATPLRIEPDLRPPPSIIFDAPKWLHMPTKEEVAAVFPKGAESDTGRVTIGCDIAIDTRVKNCRILKEAPEGQGFGEAAMRLSKVFRLEPRMVKGKPREGGVMLLNIGFKR